MTHDLLHQHNRKGKVVVWGFFFEPETDMIFGDEVRPSLVRECNNSTGRPAFACLIFLHFFGPNRRFE